MKSLLSPHLDSKSLIEPLEQRIAPATLLGSQFTTAVGGSDIKLEAAGNHDGLLPGLSTSTGDPIFGGGQYLMYVTKGSAIIHTTDLNHNGRIDFNEITGISAGAGLQMICFTDIHGDIVTNLNTDFTLTDSDNNASNGRDGRVLLNNTIESIQMRSLTAADLPTPDVNHPNLLSDRLALSSYSIFGNIYAGGGFGIVGGGLVIDTTGVSLQTAKFNGGNGVDKFVASTPEIGSIRVGTAASDQFFSFGITGASTDIHGQIVPFIAPANSHGADIIGVGAADPSMKFNLGTLQAGDGGFNSRGGNIVNVALTGDTAGGYQLIAGNAGAGQTGPVGGSIVNFSDQGSVTGSIVLKTGNGGTGLIGKGGAAGTLGFDPTQPQNLYGHVVIQLGNGGNGFTAGAAGGSLPSGNITVPEGGIPVPVSVVSTTRLVGDIGTERAFDFNGDGFSDAVYTTTIPNQLAVVFGDGTGAFDPHLTVFLNCPANAQIVVADFNGDGHPDIATASGSASSAGISVFLSQYDAVGKFTGFTDNLRSPIPSLTSGNFFEEAVPISKLAAGDFNGDGTMDLAFISTQEDITTGNQFQVLTVLSNAADATHPNGTGFFYADFTNGVTAPFVSLAKDAPNAVLKPTALKQGDTQDVLVVGFEDAKILSVVTDTAGIVLPSGSIGLGEVDTNRKINDAGKTNNQTLEEVTLRDFTILDINGDGNADVAALSKTPEGFVTTYSGDGMGAFPISSGTGDNAGIKVSGTVSNGGLGLQNTKFVGILSVNADNDPSGAVNDIALIDYRTNTEGPHVQELSFTGATNPTDLTTPINATLGASYEYGAAIAGDESIRAFDVYVSQFDTGSNGGQLGPVDYAVGSPYKTTGTHLLEVVGDDFGPVSGFSVRLIDNGFLITAGHGGNSLTGPGGAGGKIGNGALDTSTLTGGFNILLPTNINYAGTLRFVAGDGGEGFTNGGAGGDISGVTVTYKSSALHSDVFLFAGNGGDGLTGTGGAGGGLNHLHVLSADLFVGGNGGNGVIGGMGGSITGNHIAGSTDTTISGVAADSTDTKGLTSNSETIDLIVQGGAGGIGTKHGGAGGNINGFAPQFVPLIGSEGGLLYYTAGAGGDSVGGIGGKGGDVLNSSPLENGNSLVGDIFIKGGDGGNGLVGGDGGVVNGFQNSPAGSTPLSLTILGGNGGTGTSGKGGAGGAIGNVRASSSGEGSIYDFDLSDPSTVLGFNDILIDFNPITYNRIIAGQGGDSLGGSGGVGGSISHIVSTSTSTSAGFVTIAGKGGDGLVNGANGGSLNDVSITVGAQGKLLFAAGDGGNTFAKSSSGGHAGNGGSIAGASEQGPTNTNVDLIAGNGGSTINFGTAADANPKVGTGGSISNVNISGNIGNTDPAVAIKSYNDTLAGETMADFVLNTFINNPFFTFDDAIGNVGLVAGAAGHVQNNQPTSFIKNGSVSSVRASNIMSMIAGSVDQIASIQNLSNITVTTTGGIFGADKTMDSFGRTDDGHGNPYHTGTPTDYLTNDDPTTGVYTATPQTGGKLVDGAIIAKNVRPLQSVRDFILQ